MPEEIQVKDILKQLIQLVVGSEDGAKAVGGISVNPNSGSATQKTIAEVFKLISSNESTKSSDALAQTTSDMFSDLANVFEAYYSKEENKDILKETWNAIQNTQDPEEKAKHITHLFLPELNIPEDNIVKRWKLSNVKANPQPFKPTEVAIQLNALYTLPLGEVTDQPSELTDSWNSIKDNPEAKCADYDHPVPMFVKDADHELITCLAELDEEMTFEKEQNVFPADYKLPLLISVSVTHKFIDGICGDWISHLLTQNHYRHLNCYVITESKIDALKENFIPNGSPVFTVLGKYATHFNALKYMQLFMEKGYGIRAGFKLDTDEGVRSKDLFAATGKTWFQTLCHDLWGGTATDIHNQEVYLGVNEGEYVNKKDIDELGFKGALRCPDVSEPSSYRSAEIFFNKAFAHGACTRLYNQYNSLGDHISHPVVKGGGYGITNEGLRKFVPFTYSQTGRAEDQQFYFCSLSAGCRGIFQPNLRIAHYKSTGGAVHEAEQRTKATRFIGDMFRLVLFGHLVECLPEINNSKSPSTLKYDLDPMPGVFAGKLARLQAYLNILYRAYSFCEEGDEASGQALMTEGFEQILMLQKNIDSGSIKSDLVREKQQWEKLIQTIDALDSQKVKGLLEQFKI